MQRRLICARLPARSPRHMRAMNKSAAGVPSGLEYSAYAWSSGMITLNAAQQAFSEYSGSPSRLSWHHSGSSSRRGPDLSQRADPLTDPVSLLPSFASATQEISRSPLIQLRSVG